MLEKNEKICYFDTHFHLGDCLGFDVPSNWAGCSCFHSPEEWNNALEQIGALRPAQPFDIAQGPQTNSAGPEPVEGPPNQLYLSYGLHPQSAGWIDVKQCADFLETLLQQNKLNAIGEAGFDYFSQEFRQHTALQEEMFNIQLELALQYDKPMVIHARKANNKLFEYSKQFKKLPAVLFHSYMGPAREAMSLINHGINAYFSFGKQIMNNNKKVLDCVQNLPLQNLLLETDAPFQYLKGEKLTTLDDISRIYDAFIALRSETKENIFKQFEENFLRLYSC